MMTPSPPKKTIWQYLLTPFKPNREEMTVKDPQKNWRLEIWRQLAKLPESQARKNLEGHLWLDNFCEERHKDGKRVVEICKE